MNALYRLARPALFRLDPERAHGLSIQALKHGLSPRSAVPADARLHVEVAGLAFPNPLGLAAGYDKNAEVPDAALRLGFGFAEVGTLTPRPQAGNERPRIFRLRQEQAIINRLGFNNEGHDAAFARLSVRGKGRPGIVGVNIGANKDSADRVADYAEGVRRFASLASYLTINISSPNTPGLRAFQSGSELDRLLAGVLAARAEATATLPVFLKVAPDLDRAQIDEIASVARSQGIDGLIVGNTTLSRQGVEGSAHANEAGGLSGRPLLHRSTYVLAAFRRAVGSEFPLIGVGGVDDAASMIAKIEAGADLVQLYTGLVYGGPGLPARIVRDLIRHLDGTSAESISDLRDTAVDEILSRDPPPA